MDMIKELEKRKALIKRSILAEVDDKEVEKLNEELISVVEEIATIKAEKAAEEKAQKALDDAKVKEIKEKALEMPKIVITEQGMYKGVNLKRAVAKAGEIKPEILLASKQDYAKVEAAAKWFTDLTEKAIARPTSFADIQKANVSALTDAQGGYITPTEQSMELVSYMKQDSCALRNARIVNMTSDQMTMPKESYEAVVAVRAQEGAVGATSATFGIITLNTVGLDGYIPVSKEILADSPILVGTLMAQFVEATAKKIDSAVFKGTGSPMSGIFSSAVLTSATFTGVNFSSVTSAAIETILGKVLSNPQDTARLKWYVHPSVLFSNLKALKASTSGEYLYWDGKSGEGVPGRFAGFPIEYVYEAPYTTGAAKTLAVFGDLTGVIIGERLGMTSMFYDPYTSAANGLDRFFWFTRFAFNLAQEAKFGRIRTASA